MNSIDQIASELTQLSKEHMTHLWIQYTTGFDLGVQTAQLKKNEFCKNPQNYKIISECLEKSNDDLEKRKAKILHNDFKYFHQPPKVQKILEEVQALENSIMVVINSSRSELDGKEMNTTEIEKILSQSEDRLLRKKAYECRLPLNQKLVDAGFIRLLEMRKELASLSGYQNFIDYSLDKEELNSNIFLGWEAICEKRKEKFQTKAQKLAEKYLQLENLAPWDYKFLKTKFCSDYQTKVDLTHFYQPIAKTFLKFGFDIEKLNLTYDIFPRKNKSEWGYNFPIEFGKEARILANVDNSFSNYNVLLHETAHGVHFIGLNPEEYAFNHGISGIISEGFANFFGNLALSKEFLAEIFPQEVLEKSYVQFQEVQSFMHFQNFRSLSEVMFDQQLYLNNFKNADDIQALRQSISARILGETNYNFPWAQLIHHTSHPIYLHNYFLGDVMCENMKMVFAQRHSGKTADSSPLQFGQFWKEKVLAPSGRYTFMELYKNICEENLSITEYVDAKCLI